MRRVVTGSGLNIESEYDDGFMVFCPYHNNYRTPSAVISKTIGNLNCFSCYESKSLMELVMHLTKKSFFESARFIDSMETKSDIVSVMDNMLKVEPVFEPYDELLIKRLHTQAINSPRAMRYYEGRRISQDSINKFSLGYSENQDMVTIPVMEPSGNMFIGFVARSVEGKEFKNTPKLPKSKVLFNLHRAKKYDTVYVVESSFDAIRLDQNGTAAVATLGSNVSNTQCDLLTKYFNNIIVIGDNDDAGRSMQQKILDKIGRRATLISIPSRFKDIGDMTDNDIHELTTRVDDPLLAMY